VAYTEEQTLGALPGTIAVRPFGVNIHSYPVQYPSFREGPHETKEAVHCVRNHIRRRARIMAHGPGAD
jgi:hypothetical protein